MSLRDSIKKIFAPREGEDRTALSKKVQASPQDPQARQKLGIFLLRQGEVVEGLDQLARAAVMYEKDGFAGKAIAVLRQILKNDPANLDFQKWLIRLLAQEGLMGDAQRELERIASRQTMFATDDQRIDFLRQVADNLKTSPLPALFLSDVLRGQRKLYEAVAELDKSAHLAVSSQLVPEFAERITSLVHAAGENREILESCGFLWLRIGRSGEGLALLARLHERARMEGDVERTSLMDHVIAGLKKGWDASKAGAISFEDAARKMDAPAEPPPLLRPSRPFRS